MKHTLPFATLALALAMPAQSPITSTFVGGLVITNPGPAAATQYFDVNVTNPAGLVVTQFDVNVNTTAGTSGNFSVWITGVGGTHFGNQQNAAAWTQVSSDAVTFTAGRRSVPLSTPFWLAPGTYGVALHHVTFNPVYTNPNTPVPPLPQTYGNADVTLDMTSARVRTSLTTDPFGGTAVGNSPRHPNIAMHYTVGAAFADFSATPTRGASPLVVQFTSRYGTGNGPIVAYAWDLDGDGTTDSNAPNPTFTYTTCGNYNVTLTVVDQLGPITVGKTNFIQTDIVVPSFMSTLLAANTLQFTDTSSPTPTSWAWDLDGDGITDATQPNPVWTYPAGCGEVQVSLTVGRACQPPVTLSQRIAVAQSLTTRFDGATFTVAGNTGGANFFDLGVTASPGIAICGMHVHSSVPNGGPLTVRVHTTPGTWVGNHANAAAWRLAGSGSTTSRALGQRTFVAFNPPIFLPTGAFGICVEHLGASPYYINVGGNQTFSNADLTLTAGGTQAEPVLGTGTLFQPRIVNTAIWYTTCNLVPEAGYGFFGPGCPGALGIPRNTATALPKIGQTLSVQIDRLPQNVGFFLLGFSNTISAFGPLPVDLTVFGAPGCLGRVSPDATSLLVGTANAATFGLGIPNSASLLCVQFHTQTLALDTPANALGGVLSDAATGVIGQ